MEPCGHISDFERLHAEIVELRDCKMELATIKEYRQGSEEKFREIKENISKLFARLEGNEVTRGIKGEIADIKNLLIKFEENITEVYDRIEKIEELLERTIKEVYELTPLVKALMSIEDERKAEKNSFRREFRIWLIGFIGTVLLTATVTWFNINSNKVDKPQQAKDIAAIIIQVEHQRDSLALIKRNP